MSNSGAKMSAKRHIRSGIFVLVLVSALVAGPVTNAQQDKKWETPGAGKGAVIVDNYFGGDPETLNPILVKTATAGNITALMFPQFLRLHWDTGLPTPDLPNALVKSFKASDDGLVYTFTLRDDMKWNDGKPITSADVKYAYDAIVSTDVESNLRAGLTASVSKLEAPDATTVVVTFKTADCAALFRVSGTGLCVPRTSTKKYPTLKE
jgi:peptide/nickel transport system substrate-binding protein